MNSSLIGDLIQTREIEDSVRVPKKCCSKENQALHLDKKSAIIFPAIFSVFNFIYWTYFVFMQ